MMAKEKAAPVARAEKNESVYTILEFVENARRVFGVSPNLVTAALTRGGKDHYTIDEAKSIVKKFSEREV